ncbi:MAG TPA: C40 family peptidase [Amnibacterium sp.]|uniref:C40 family peptidase n=1 Tax=Amnibacterium sp. TaxID=1872496 RepID=UPI002F95ECE8
MRRHHTAPISIAVGAVTLTAVTAAFTITPAVADEPTYPSWQDVQNAANNATAAKAEVAKITKLITSLQGSADAAGRSAQIAAERLHTAQAAEAAAKQQHDALAAQADAAAARARTSRMRAGLLAAHLARSTGGDLSTDLMLNSDSASDMLYRLATMSQLSTQSAAIYSAAVADENAAKSLTAQADAAQAELQQRADAAASALADAKRTSAAAEAAVAAQQKHANELLSQLAQLQHTSTSVAAAYVAGVQRKKDQEAAQQQAAGGSSGGGSSPGGGGSSSGGGDSSSGGGGSSSGGSGSSSGGGGSSSGGGGSSSGGGGSSSGGSGSVGSGNTSQAAGAVAFAREQIGDMYQFAGAGPNVWDCSGLTMQAYASVGLGIGGHSATAQYDVARANGQLVPYSQAQSGDLVFYTDGGGDMYHVAIYSGGGMMIEAPYDGVPVREVPVRDYQRMPVVARPSA